MKNLKERYSKLSNEFSLPSYEELNNEFELLYIKELFEINRPLVFIRRRIIDKLGWVGAMLQGIIQPNPGSLLSMEESSFFTKEEKDDLIKTLKDLMFYTRKSINLDLESKDVEEAEFIKESLKKWAELKPRIKEISLQLKNGWKKEKVSKKVNNNYMG
ncbi:hypothetical protein HOM13_02410 [Candidatus Woesearchaeota archaeon]|jgi:hypothetical protein|nr:hypothetical protein [Candidatus Woesearchaeota archaeon]MBT5215568.1 hypothetical protein [Candidatus Woesearchaeota archaeon]MBT6401877.1 hypothetical protein [Candidatus Woesearchaeota archaeon]